MFKHLGTLIYTGSSTQEELFFMSANLSLLPSSLPPRVLQLSFSLSLTVIDRLELLAQLACPVRGPVRGLL